MNVAVSLLEAANGSGVCRGGSRIVTMVSGAATYGPGMIVSEDV